MNPLATQLASRSLEGATGAFDWTDGKRRRVIFLADGEVVLIQSNLRSESPERLQELNSSLSGDDLTRAVARARLAGAVGEPAGEFRWTAGLAAPRREPADIPDALFMAGLPRVPITAYLRVTGQGVGWIARQPIAAELGRYLCELDGTRTADEVLAFAPGGPEATERWVRIGFAVGAFMDVGIESSTFEVRPINKKRAWSGGVDDIASLIAEGLGEDPATPISAPTRPDPVASRLGPILTRINAATDHFAVLGVSWQDNPESMRRAYFTLARELHPDRYTDDSDEVRQAVADLFDRVRAAWEVLGDDGKRQAYIAKVIRGEKTEEELAMEKVKAILDSEQDFKRGLSDFYAGRLQQAHDLFQKCAERVPEEMEFVAYAGYTTFKLYSGKDEERAGAGAERVAEAVRAAEKLDSGWVLLGLIRRAKGDERGAREALVQALKLKPANPDALRELKRLEKEKDRPASAPATSGAAGLFNRFFGARKPKPPDQK